MKWFMPITLLTGSYKQAATHDPSRVEMVTGAGSIILARIKDNSKMIAKSLGSHQYYSVKLIRCNLIASPHLRELAGDDPVDSENTSNDAGLCFHHPWLS
jgi:hypothetical protein